MNIKLKFINEIARKYIPIYQTGGAAAVDLAAAVDKAEILYPHEVKAIPTGLAMYIEDSHLCGLIVPRSGLGTKHGIVMANSTGIVDSDYQGEIVVYLKNMGAHNYTVYPGDRIAQMLFVPIQRIRFEAVESFEPTDRGDKGFGSTGLNCDEIGKGVF